MTAPLPDFPDSRPLELEDGTVLESLLEREQPVVSELSFANLYVWRRTYDFRLSSIGEGLAIRPKDRDGARPLRAVGQRCALDAEVQDPAQAVYSGHLPVAGGEYEVAAHSFFLEVDHDAAGEHLI